MIWLLRCSKYNTFNMKLPTIIVVAGTSLIFCYFLDLGIAQNQDGVVGCQNATIGSTELYKAMWNTTWGTGNALQPPFDYYRCQWDTRNQIWLLYPFKCPGSRNGSTYGYCNFFDEGLQMCDTTQTPSASTPCYPTTNQG